MKMNIAENIRKFRKERGLTQEQLAEALGVTVGAVSKWELGASVPDINLIMELSDFFETSVDVLLGYEWRKSNMGIALEKIKEARLHKDYEQGIKEIEKALVKYPNCFDIAYHSAALYHVAGLEQQDEKALRRALELLQRANELIGQNTNPEINSTSIELDIAQVLQGLGEYDQSIQQLKKHNINGINNCDIGFTLAVFCRKPDEALPYLSHALVKNITDLYQISIGYSNVFAEKEDYQSSLDILLWMRSLIASLKKESGTSYLDKMEVTLLAACAGTEATLENPEMVREYLQQAIEIALRFDAAPDFSMNGLKYYYGKEDMRIFDSLGAGALESIEHALTQEDDSAHTTSAFSIFKEIWEELKNEESANNDKF